MPDGIFDYTVPEPRCELPEIHPDISTQLRSLHPIFVNTDQLNKFQHDACIEAQTYDRLIRVLETRLLEAKVMRSNLQEKSAQVSSLLSPVRRLPTEIIREIFILAVGDAKDNMFGSCSKWESRTLDISAVCHRWRIIALDTPELWDRFSVDLNTRAQAPLELFLSRSRESPLSITITQTDDDIVDFTLATQLIAHASRWSSLDHHYLDERIRHIITEEVSDLPILQYVTCCAQGRSFPVELSEQLRRCSLLNTLVVRYGDSSQILVPSLPSDHIMNLKIQCRHSGALKASLEMLRSYADNVKTITYSSTPTKEDYSHVSSAQHVSFAEPVKPFACRDVWRFRVNLYNRDGIYRHLMDIFQSLELPSLRALSLIGDCETNGTFEGEWPAYSFNQFVGRSKCTLTKFVLDGIPISDTELIAALRHFPSLVDLMIIELFMNEDNLQPDKLVQTVTKLLVGTMVTTTLAAHGQPGDCTPAPFLPKLEILTLFVHAHFDADVEFVKMVQSRWYTARSSDLEEPSHLKQCRIRSVTLGVQGREVQEAIYEPLKVCDAEGMRVVVKANGNYIV
ncbi:hypothetical protein AAF712_009220 [Marasmius tenuissimus]|uniref:F-box domain-containing protein n=1 Tax=Marasmius tenuissimus TaxID=585030 RepID=A0ABR2ZU71_9AGAR